MVQNHSFIIRDKENWHYAIHTHEVKEWHSLGYTNKDIAKEYDCTFIVLTTAHLDHNKNNNHFSNLSALCQKCHLKHDLKHHIQNRKYGRKHKLNQTKLEL